MHFNAYPELYNYANSLLVYFSHNLDTGTRAVLTSTIAHNILTHCFLLTTTTTALKFSIMLK